MGCDGGTIPKRHELVKTAKRPPQKDKDMDRSAKWSTCCISEQNLVPPLMTCELGKLYSKESVIEFLLDRSISEAANHIRSLKDVKELKLTYNSGYKKPSSELADQYHETQSSEYVCPIVGIEMNGRYKFCTLWTCGCVLSDRALKEVDSPNCHNCAQPFDKQDIIVLNPEKEDLALMEVNMNLRRERAKALKKEEKQKKNAKRKLDSLNFKCPLPLINGVESSTEASSLSGKEKKMKKTDKLIKSNGTKVDLIEDKDKQNKTKSPEIDIKKSQVYKNLFSSSEDNKKRLKPHWVTYNPYHLG